MTQWPVPSNHSIVVAGLPLYMEIEHSTDGPDILPGDLVEFAGTSDCTVKAGQVDSVSIIGVADISPQSATTPPRGSSRDATSPTTGGYTDGDQVKIVRGPLCVMLRIAASSDIGCGDFVQPAASGEVKEYYCITDNDCQRIAQALETTTVNTLSFEWGMFALERFG